MLLVTEADPTEREQSANDTRNTHVLGALAAAMVERARELDDVFEQRASTARGDAQTDDPEKIVATVTDRRDVSIAGVHQDWQLGLGDRHALSFGAEYQRQRADYDYSAAADYFGFFLTFPGIPPTLRRSAATSPRAATSRGAYVADRWQITGATTAELGLRFDRYGYAGTPDERHVSPRVSVRHELGERTALRWSLGRYFQPQGLHELQVEDGVTEFYPAQRADQAVIGVEQRLGERYLLRAEAYRKSLRPPAAALREPVRSARDPARARARPRAHRTRRGVGARPRALGRLRRAGTRAAAGGRATCGRARRTSSTAKTVRRSWDQRHAAQLGIGHDSGRLGLERSARLPQRLADDGAHARRVAGR